MIEVSLRDVATSAWGRAVASTRLTMAARSRAAGIRRRHCDRSGCASRMSERLAKVTAYLRRRRRTHR